MKLTKIYLVTACVFIALSIGLRLLPHPPNFAPLTALALLAGAKFGSKQAGVMMVIAAAVISDMIIGFYGLTMLVVWLSYAAIAIFSNRYMKHADLAHGIGVTLASSVFFFMTTNFAVWAFSGLYPRTLNGVAESYVSAMPFFRNSLVGDLVYAVSFFGLYTLTTTLTSATRTRKLVADV